MLNNPLNGEVSSTGAKSAAAMIEEHGLEGFGGVPGIGVGTGGGPFKIHAPISPYEERSLSLLVGGKNFCTFAKTLPCRFKYLLYSLTKLPLINIYIYIYIETENYGSRNCTIQTI